MARPTKKSTGTRSGFEARIHRDLHERGVPFAYEPRGSRLPYRVMRHYLPDFVLPNGVHVEAKGWFKPADRSKMLAVREAHPDIDIRFLFQRASNTLSGSSTTTYAAWATKHGFPWAEGRIPDDWLLPNP